MPLHVVLGGLIAILGIVQLALNYRREDGPRRSLLITLNGALALCGVGIALTGSY